MTVVISFVVLSLFALALLIYIIYAYESFQNQTGFFKPFKPDPPSNSCNPLGGVRKLSPDEIAKRKQNLQNPPAKGTPVFCGSTMTSDII